jgi:hypothetical protein
MNYLDPPQPAEVTWESSKYDGYRFHRGPQADLRETVIRLTRPQVPVKELARRCGMAENSVRGFIYGRAITPAHERLMRKVLAELLAEDERA